MDCNKCELFQPNYMYLDHVSSFLYDELLGMTEIFNNQVLELNKTALENMQNEAKASKLMFRLSCSYVLYPVREFMDERD